MLYVTNTSFTATTSKHHYIYIYVSNAFTQLPKSIMSVWINWHHCSQNIGPTTNQDHLAECDGLSKTSSSHKKLSNELKLEKSACRNPDTLRISVGHGLLPRGYFQGSNCLG